MRDRPRWRPAPGRCADARRGASRGPSWSHGPTVAGLASAAGRGGAGHSNVRTTAGRAGRTWLDGHGLANELHGLLERDHRRVDDDLGARGRLVGVADAGELA